MILLHFNTREIVKVYNPRKDETLCRKNLQLSFSLEIYQQSKERIFVRTFRWNFVYYIHIYIYFIEIIINIVFYNDSLDRRITHWKPNLKGVSTSLSKKYKFLRSKFKRINPIQAKYIQYPIQQEPNKRGPFWRLGTSSKFPYRKLHATFTVLPRQSFNRRW